MERDQARRPESAPEDRDRDKDRIAKLALDTFNTDSGSEFLDYLCDRFGLLNRVFIKDRDGNVDPIRAAIREGERAVVIEILKAIRHARRSMKDPDKNKILLPIPP